MIRINEHYLKLQASYLFSDIKQRMTAFRQAHPERDLIKLGIGDVTHPLPPACVAAFHAAVDEMADAATFRGYGPEQGYPFLRELIAAEEFQARGAHIHANEIFVSDGAKCDTGNFQEILDAAARIAIPDPVYPVYIDTNVMAGRTGAFRDGRYEGIVYLECTAANGFVAQLPPDDAAVDVVYLCFPNNPTGATVTHAQLAAWVDWAQRNRALILYDAAYQAFIRDDALPRSIYEVDGAHEVAIEFRSFSKTAGFTGTRCAFTVVPEACRGYDASGAVHSLHTLWHRRHTTKFNGVSYPVQKAAAAAYGIAGKAQIEALIDGYMQNAALVREAMTFLGFECVGGENAPYIWVDCQEDDWAFFDRLLHQAGVVCTPGSGFGTCGRNYVRISAFNHRENVQRAMDRIHAALS